MAGAGSNKTGWEEPSPPAQRRNIPNYDDGTSLWGNPAQQQGRMGGMCIITFGMLVVRDVANTKHKET
jgi:hypothetical protein